MKDCLKVLLFIPFVFLLACGEAADIPRNHFLFQHLAIDSKEIRLEDFIDAQGKPTELSRTIAECAFLFNKDYPCSLETLSFLGNTADVPSKEQIMQRVIVSHSWMADSFSAALDAMPEDMYKLFASTTAIVIHANIRPAYFWSDTGAIYLDPQYLWRTEAEFNTINHEADYRAGFGSALNYMSLARYSKNGIDAWSYDARSDTDVLYALSALLFHELAHARDAFSLATIKSAAHDLAPYEIYSTATPTSQVLENTYPLTDPGQTLHTLARVQFRGETAGQDVIDLFAEDVAALFAPDGANDEYGYLEYEQELHFEDTAMLFEEVMLKRHFNIDRELAFANILREPIEYCDDFDIRWSVINRFMDASVLPRARLVVNQLLPDNDHASFFSNLPARGQYTYCLPETRQARSKQAVRQKIQPVYDWH